jgi:hypothetical protein
VEDLIKTKRSTGISRYIPVQGSMMPEITIVNTVRKYKSFMPGSVPGNSKSRLVEKNGHKTFYKTLFAKSTIIFSHKKGAN